MRLLVKKGLNLINDLRFSDGPIYIGRLPKCQIFIPDRTISRQHAVIYANPDGIWMAQDLESSNRTTVNGRPISKMPIHEGDTIGVADFNIEVHLEPATPYQVNDNPLDLGDTAVAAQTQTSTIYQTTRQTTHTLHINSQRLQHFYDLNMALCRIDDQEELLGELTEILLKQFKAYHVWAGLRETTMGPLTCHGGLCRNGDAISLDILPGKDLVIQALNSETYILLPDVTEADEYRDIFQDDLQYIRSAMATPIIAPAGAYGVIYIDNSVEQNPYVHQAMDYLTLVSTQLAAFIEHIG